MNYTLSSDDPFNTTLSAHGRPVYSFQTYAPPTVPRLTTLVLALDPSSSTGHTVPPRSSTLPPPPPSSMSMMSSGSRRSHGPPHAHGHVPAPSLYSTAPSALSELASVAPSTFSLPSLIPGSRSRRERERDADRATRDRDRAQANGQVQPYAYENHSRAPSAREIARDEKRRVHAPPPAAAQEPFVPPRAPFPPDVKRRPGQPDPYPQGQQQSQPQEQQQQQQEDVRGHGHGHPPPPRHAFSSDNLHSPSAGGRHDRPDPNRRRTMVDDREGGSVHSSRPGSRIREGDRRSGKAAEVARVAWLAPGRVLVLVGERAVGVHKRLWGSSRTFTAANGVSYKWSFTDDGATLTTNDGKRAQAATYTSVRGNGVGARLQLTPHGTSIRDDIFATLVCVLGERRGADKMDDVR
ncbi:hypothetical protein CONPUDRAFT_80194 [Coniophora puteana RWD-64-598 SS2]|uniref:DUF6593 domain-containing protein n=1 Tax=Coniophora puteana (strain RWD-64-598) TaxID=741705 RepID=A0A5M3N2X6_CONPW|nr:uncharacterized protein CONPUDRAFT_80194 [Coniophora puteana RWD-64-598 SS2]EIW85739.1 hypothetical protein CONPUDRAFT_80194 [Coniophora puteana RWD-64-598 SS2]